MKYFTAKEANAIIAKSSMALCGLYDGNPNLAAMKELANSAARIEFRGGFYWAACMGFVLGRATGIREERARRKEAAV